MASGALESPKSSAARADEPCALRAGRRAIIPCVGARERGGRFARGKASGASNRHFFPLLRADTRAMRPTAYGRVGGHFCEESSRARAQKKTVKKNRFWAADLLSEPISACRGSPKMCFFTPQNVFLHQHSPVSTDIPAYQAGADLTAGACPDTCWCKKKHFWV